EDSFRRQTPPLPYRHNRQKSITPFCYRLHLSYEFYSQKRILDIGCGPRGSLDWAQNALERIGLDPLADEYKKLNSHLQMTILRGKSESIPFADNYFDVVCSFNSLDHVDDLKVTVSEIKRVLKPSGTFLLIADLHPEPTACEPVTFTWNLLQDHFYDMEIDEEKHYEKSSGIYQSIKDNIPFDHTNTSARYGIVSAKMTKKVSVGTDTKLPSR
ncbi:MAG: class I SAM-dependent methyltransferase, partial [Deltaproteobacteria bacterium]|nr:class I SAM-dependent methyltransferase [Deltaproteobacteria bacterium]